MVEEAVRITRAPIRTNGEEGEGAVAMCGRHKRICHLAWWLLGVGVVSENAVYYTASYYSLFCLLIWLSAGTQALESTERGGTEAA